VDTPPIVFTTDFGLADPYMGIMKGVVLGINPRAALIDLTHQVSPQNVRQAAFVLGYSAPFFPPGSVHVVVVDPQVGTPRRALLLVTPQARFVAPDNGVLSYVVRDYLDSPPRQAGRVRIPQGLTAYSLTNSEYWLHPVSHTFHGRDIFAPAAAHLSLGVSPDSLGEQVDDMGWFPAPQPMVAANTIRGEVVYIDHFGNLVTNIPAQTLAEGSTAQVKIKGRLIPGLSRTFHDPSHQPEGGLLALIGSHGHLEIAVRDGSAARSLGADVGEGVEITVPPAALPGY
jgi:hypothetical protein